MSVNKISLRYLYYILIFLLFSTSVCAESTRRGWTITYINVIEKALYKFKEDIGRYPTSTEGLNSLVLKPDAMLNWNGPYLKRSEIPLDRWNNELEYIYPPIYGSKDFDLYSFGANGIDNLGKEDDITNWSD